LSPNNNTISIAALPTKALSYCPLGLIFSASFRSESPETRYYISEMGSLAPAEVEIENHPLWTPRKDSISALNIEVFRKAVNEKYGLSLGN
jgi:hypothetical protein